MEKLSALTAEYLEEDVAISKMEHGYLTEVLPLLLVIQYPRFGCSGFFGKQLSRKCEKIK